MSGPLAGGLGVGGLAADVALWDLAGNIAGLPVHALMGTHRTAIGAAGPGHALPHLVAEDRGGSDRADTDDVGQGRVRGFHGFGDALVDRVELAIEDDHVIDEVGRELTAGLARGVTGTHGREQGLGLVHGQLLARPSRNQLHQGLVQAVDRLSPGPDQVTAALRQQPHHDRLVIDGDLAQAHRAQPHDRDRVGVGRVVLATVPGVDCTHPGRELRRDIDDALTVTAAAGQG